MPKSTPMRAGMRFPARKLLYLKLLITAIFLSLLTTKSFSQTDDFNQAENKNGAPGSHTIDWINGILNSTHTDYFEGISVPQRHIFTGLGAGQHTLKIKFLTKKGVNHAYDFLTSWQQAYDAAAYYGNGSVNELSRLFIDECRSNSSVSAAGQAACAGLASSSFVLNPEVPDAMDPLSAGPGVYSGADPFGLGTPAVDSKITIYENNAKGATGFGNRTIEIKGSKAISGGNVIWTGYDGDYATYSITWTNSASNTDILVRYAGHLSLGQGAGGYGLGLGSGGINGGPYHFKFDNLFGPTNNAIFSGDQDNQIMSGAIQVPPTCNLSNGTVICPETSSVQFTSTGNAPNTALAFSFVSNTANATFSSSGSVQTTLNASADGSGNYTVTVYPQSGGFTAGGSFKIQVVATLNGLSSDPCIQSVATTVDVTSVTATATPSSINLNSSSHSSTLAASGTVNGTQDNSLFTSFTWAAVLDPGFDNGSAGLSSTSGASVTFTPTAAGSYKFRVTAVSADGCNATNTVIVNVSAGGTCPTITGPTTVCANTEHLSFSASARPAFTHYEWSISSGNAVITNSVKKDVSPIDVTSGTNNFTVLITVSFDNTDVASFTCPYPVTVNTVNPGVIAGGGTLCSPFDPAAFTSTTDGSGPAGTVITYRWESSTTSGVAGFSTISGATSATYDPPAVSQQTWYRRVTISTLNSVACEANSNVLTVIPNDINPGVVAGGGTLCSPFDPAAFTNTTSGSSVAGGAITYQWQSSTTSGVTGFTDISGATSATYDAPAVSVQTWYRRVATSTLNSVPCSANSNVLTVIPNDIVPGVIAGGGTLCSPFDPAAFTNTTSASSVAGGAITYQWQSSTTSAVTGFTDISGATNATYDAPAVSVPTWYRRVATSTLNSVPCSANSNVLSVVPNDITPGVIAGGGTLCSPFNPDAFTNTTSGSSVAGGAITYQWQSSTTSSVAGFTDISGATNATYDAPAVSQQTWYRRVATSTLNSVPCSANSNVLTVIPNPVTPGTIGANQDICNGGTADAITTVTAATGSNLHYQWYSSPTGCDANDFTAIANSDNASYSPGVLTQNMYYKRKVTSTLNDVTCEATSNCITVLVHDCITNCTYTQGYYGNKNGNSCDGTSTYQSPLDLIKYLLGITTTPQALNPVVVGAGSYTVTVPATVDGATALNNVMPGGNTPVALTQFGNVNVSTVSGSDFVKYYLTKQGRINNVLLSQTIALTLNTRINNGHFLQFPIQAGTLVIKSVQNCGTLPWTLSVTGTIQMNTNVANYLNGGNGYSPTIAGLLALANDVLGHVKTAGSGGVPSFGDITNAVDVINKSFDECGSAFYMPAPLLLTQSGAVRGQLPVELQPVLEAKKLSVAAFPNPYTDNVRFVIVSPTDGRATLDLYNILGQKVKTIYDGYIEANKTQVVDFRTLQSQTFIYRMQVGDQYVTGKLLKLER